MKTRPSKSCPLADQGLSDTIDVLCRFLADEEEITMEYKFGVYDLLVLPPSFPYGGMVCIVYAMALAWVRVAHSCPLGKRMPDVRHTE